MPVPAVDLQQPLTARGQVSSDSRELREGLDRRLAGVCCEGKQQAVEGLGVVHEAAVIVSLANQAEEDEAVDWRQRRELLIVPEFRLHCADAGHLLSCLPRHHPPRLCPRLKVFEAIDNLPRAEAVVSWPGPFTTPAVERLRVDAEMGSGSDGAQATGEGDSHGSQYTTVRAALSRAHKHKS